MAGPGRRLRGVKGSGRRFPLMRRRPRRPRPGPQLAGVCWSIIIIIIIIIIINDNDREAPW